MQQLPDTNCHSIQLQWDAIKLQAVLRNADKALTYVLLTNSVKLSSIEEAYIEEQCEKCKHRFNSLIFTVKAGDLSKQGLALQVEGLKCCVLPFKENQCRLEESLGDKSTINEKKSSFIANNLIISSDKIIRQSEQVDRALYYTAASRQSTEEPSFEDLSSSVVFSLHKEQEVIEHYKLFVTKLQREVGETYRSYMFYEYAWTEAEIEHIMQRVDKHFGPIHSFIPKRRYLCFTFAKNKNDYLFKNKYEAINKELLFKQQVKLQGNILNYYLVSRQQLLPNEQQSGKLFLLPNNEGITDMIIANQWIIVAAESYLMFVHSQRPMEYFHHQQKIFPTQLAPHCNDNRIVFASDKRGFIYCFLLEESKVVVQAKHCVSFLIPYSLVHVQNGICIAGIDIQSSKKLSRRSVYVINTEGKQKNQKPLPISARLEVAVINGENKNPINNIASTKQKDVVGCTWSNKLFLISLQGYKLIEVELKSTINKMMAVPFLFNHLNFIILLANGEVVRVGVECYGQGLGAELCQIKGAQVMDCIYVSGGSSRFELYGCEGHKIDKISYLNDHRQRFLYQDAGKIIKLASSNEGMAYLLDLEHSIELKFLEI